MQLRGGGGGGRRLMANIILNFHFDYLITSLSAMTFLPTNQSQHQAQQRGYLSAMIPGISCSAISISLRPYTCAEILRTQKSELPWLFVCDVFSLGDACSHISLKHINSDQSRLCDKSSGKWGLSPHPHRCWIQCTIQS